MSPRLPALAMLAVAVGCGGSAQDDPNLYTLDLKGFGTAQVPGGLAIANRTLVFPLARDARTQALSPSNPGDLVAEYTRVGCWVDPAAYRFQVREVEPVPLLQVTIDQFVDVGVTATPQQLAEGTCLSLESQDGAWMAFLQPEKTTLLSAQAIRVQFAVDQVMTSGAAIFLPTYTNVSRISYRVAAP